MIRRKAIKRNKKSIEYKLIPGRNEQHKKKPQQVVNSKHNNRNQIELLEYRKGNGSADHSSGTQLRVHTHWVVAGIRLVSAGQTPAVNKQQ